MLRLSPDKSRYQFDQPTCHSRLNNIGKMSLHSNRYTSTLNPPRPGAHNSSSKDKNGHGASQSIRHERMNTLDGSYKSGRAIRHGYTKSITEMGDTGVNPERYEKLEKRVELIRNMGLLGGLCLKQVKIPTVHNDYHSASSNPGYSRKPDGGIYPK